MNFLSNMYHSITVYGMEIYVQIIISAVLGMLIGWNRTANNKPAGLKTFTFVTVSCTLITIISINSAEIFGGTNINNRVDPMRLTAQIVSGLGFLGAGLILKDGLRVKGLTSAAMILFSGGVGIGIGAGFYALVIFTVMITLLFIKFANYVESKEIIEKEKPRNKRKKKPKKT